MDRAELEARAYDEAQRLLERDFSFYNPYTCIIEADEIPFGDRDRFYGLVEIELAAKGEKISRDGQYFKISKYQNTSK